MRVRTGRGRRLHRWPRRPWGRANQRVRARRLRRVRRCRRRRGRILGCRGRRGTRHHKARKCSQDNRAQPGSRGAKRRARPGKAVRGDKASRGSGKASVRARAGVDNIRSSGLSDKAKAGRGRGSRTVCRTGSRWRHGRGWWKQQSPGSRVVWGPQASSTRKRKCPARPRWVGWSQGLRRLFLAVRRRRKGRAPMAVI